MWKRARFACLTLFCAGGILSCLSLVVSVWYETRLDVDVFQKRLVLSAFGGVLYAQLHVDGGDHGPERFRISRRGSGWEVVDLKHLRESLGLSFYVKSGVPRTMGYSGEFCVFEQILEWERRLT